MKILGPIQFKKKKKLAQPMVISKRSIISPLPGDCDQKRQKKKNRKVNIKMNRKNRRDLFSKW